METTTAVDALAALAQETRLDLFRLLVRVGDEGVAAGELAERLGVSAPALSFHLKELRNAGLVERQRRGRHLVYSARFETVNALVEFLMAECCQGLLPAKT